MKPHLSFVLRASVLIFVVAACAPARTAPTAAPSPAPTAPAAATPAPTPAPSAAPQEAQSNWHLLDATTDHVIGIGAERAKGELLAGKQPKKVVLVAVIDGGIDTAHASLKPNLWSNPKEIPGNKIDDDKDALHEHLHHHRHGEQEDCAADRARCVVVPGSARGELQFGPEVRRTPARYDARDFFRRWI